MFLPCLQSLVLRHANWCMPPEIIHYIVTEVTMQIPTFAAIVRLSHVNSQFAASCQSIVRGRIRFALSRFMETQGYQMFFDILESKRALVAGSVALSVINPLSFSEHSPKNLDIMTPRNTLPAWIEWAKGQHAIEERIDKPRFNKRDSTKCVFLFSIMNVSVVCLFGIFSYLLAGIPN